MLTSGGDITCSSRVRSTDVRYQNAPTTLVGSNFRSRVSSSEVERPCGATSVDYKLQRLPTSYGTDSSAYPTRFCVSSSITSYNSMRSFVFPAAIVLAARYSSFASDRPAAIA